MAIAIKVIQGGGTAAGTADFTDYVPLWDLSPDGEHSPTLDVGMMASSSGGACQWQFVAHDDDGSIKYGGTPGGIEAHNVVLVTEDAPGYDAWLGRGRVSTVEIDEGDHPFGNYRRHVVTVDDANIDLKGLALTSPWTRAEETDVARAIAAIEEFAQGSPRATTNITAGTAHLVTDDVTRTMPAHTYPAGTDLIDIIEDCASTGGKNFQVVIHHVSSASHLCLMYIDEADLTTFASTLSITDTSPNYSTSFPPIFDQGQAVIIDGGENPVSDMVVTYGAGTASYVHESRGTAITDRYDYWSAAFADSNAETVQQASARADGFADARAVPDRTHQITIMIPAASVDELCAGMAITIRSARAFGGENLGQTVTRRIAQLKWELVGPEVGAVEPYYFAHMQLEQPKKTHLERFGKAPIFNIPCAEFATVGSMGGTATLDPVNYTATGSLGTGPNVERVQLTTSRGASPGQSIVVITTQRGSSASANQVVDDAGNTYTKVSEHTDGSGNAVVRIWYSNVSSTLSSGGKITYEVDVGSGTGSLERGGKAISAYLFDGTIASGAESGTGSAFSSAPSLSVASGGLIVAAVGWKGGATGFPDTFTPDGDWTAFTAADTTDDGADSQALRGGFRVSDADGESYTGAIDQNRDWVTVGATFTVTEAGDCDEPEPIGESGSAAPGDSDAAARLDHVHAHGDLTGDFDYHDADQISIDDTAGNFTATDVEAALAELASGTVGAYLTKTGGEKHTVAIVSDAGSATQLDLADGNVFEITLTEDCTISATGFTAGKWCEGSVIVHQDSTGGWDITFDTPFETPTGGISLPTTADTTSGFGFGSLDGGTTIYVWANGSGGASELDDLTDVTITSPATADRLRYNGSAWVNSSLKWTPLTVYDGTNYLPLVDGNGNQIMAEA